MGRVMIMMFGSLVALAIAVGIAAIPALVVFLISSSWIAALVTGWFGLMMLGSGLLFGVAHAFKRFDISTDMPD